MSDSNQEAASSLIISITFLESAIITGSFLLIGQATSSSTAQENALALVNSSSADNAAFTGAAASVFQSWLTESTSAYVSQLVSGQDAEEVLAIDLARLALFGGMAPPDVKVLSSDIDHNTSALLMNNSTASVQTVAYNVTLQVTVLTASLLSSVFVNVFNSTAIAASKRHLLADTDAHKDNAQRSLVTAACLQQQVDASTARSHGFSSSSHSRSSRGSSSEPVGSSIGSNTHGSYSKNHGSCDAGVQGRHLQASSSFPLVSLLLFKMGLTLAAFHGTSGCSTQSIGELFYGGVNLPEALPQLCSSSDGDLSLNEALLDAANSSIPLYQVCAHKDLRHGNHPVQHRSMLLQQDVTLLLSHMQSLTGAQRGYVCKCSTSRPHLRQSSSFGDQSRH